MKTILTILLLYSASASSNGPIPELTPSPSSEKSDETRIYERSMDPDVQERLKEREKMEERYNNNDKTNAPEKEEKKEDTQDKKID